MIWWPHTFFIISFGTLFPLFLLLLLTVGQHRRNRTRILRNWILFLFSICAWFNCIRHLFEINNVISFYTCHLRSASLTFYNNAKFNDYTDILFADGFLQFHLFMSHTRLICSMYKVWNFDIFQQIRWFSTNFTNCRERQMQEHQSNWDEFHENLSFVFINVCFSLNFFLTTKYSHTYTQKDVFFVFFNLPCAEYLLSSTIKLFLLHGAIKKQNWGEKK